MAETTYELRAINPGRLDQFRATGKDDLGNAPKPFCASGGEQLRCCLTRASTGEALALIAYRPTEPISHWSEVGPVFVHAEPCQGFDPAGGTPPDLRRGQHVVRPYTTDGALYYAGIRVLGRSDDLDGVLSDLFADPAVSVVHVRNVAAQCFRAKAVRRSAA